MNNFGYLAIQFSMAVAAHLLIYRMLSHTYIIMRALRHFQSGRRSELVRVE